MHREEEDIENFLCVLRVSVVRLSHSGYGLF